MVHASPAVFIHLLSPTNKLGKNLLRLIFSAHNLLPAFIWLNGILSLHKLLLAACLFVTSSVTLYSLVFRCLISCQHLARLQNFHAFNTNTVVWSTVRVLTHARSRLFLSDETKKHR